MKTIFVAVIGTMFAAALPAFAAAGDDGKEVRVVGCVQWEKDYFKATRKATAYSITGDREKELGRRIGQQIEVIGIIEDEGKADVKGFGDLPRIKMTAWVPVKDSCSPQ